MRRLKMIISIVSVSLFFSCNPNAGKEMITAVVKLNATISNTSETIALGDILKIKLFLPDTVISSSGIQAVQSLQRGFFAMRSFKIDTINRRAIRLTPPVYSTSVGSIEGDLNFVLQNSVKPYEVVINYKPTERGLYYLEVIPQPGILKINGNSEINLLVNFSVIEKHLTLVSNYFSGQAWLDAANQQINEGYGIYAFRVN
jgi:hypothetical protein